MVFHNGVYFIIILTTTFHALILGRLVGLVVGGVYWMVDSAEGTSLCGGGAGENCGGGWFRCSKKISLRAFSPINLMRTLFCSIKI